MMDLDGENAYSVEMHISRYFNFPSGNGKFGQFPGREKIVFQIVSQNLRFFGK